MPGIFLTTNIFAHVGGFFMSGLDDGGDVCLQTNVVSAVVVGGATVTDETDKTDNNGQGWSRVCKQTPAVCPRSRAQRSEGALTAAARLPPRAQRSEGALIAAARLPPSASEPTK